ncbi:hypothetical protein AB0O34_13145 [Sphaerisporangium sp. NPDC088356]|uniref:hypothetical protein n=1 Tax=Sphaerisporangium sp. NPDC088356 TaxID=3154871 RepID=UPI00343E346B
MRWPAQGFGGGGPRSRLPWTVMTVEDEWDHSANAADAIAHVLKRCEKGRFPWARAYADRLAVDQPGDPFPLLLQALIHAYQGDAEACRTALTAADGLGPVTVHADLRATIADLLLHPGTSPIPEDTVADDDQKFRAKDVAGCLLVIVALAALAAAQHIWSWLVDAGGDQVASLLGIRGHRVDGHSTPGLIIVVAMVGLLWWAVKAVRGGRGARGDRSRRRARVRSFAAELDDDNIRMYACAVAMCLPFSLLFALVPTAVAGMNPTGGWLIAAWTVGVSCAVIWRVCGMVGVRTVTRAVRLSRLLAWHALAAYGVIGAFAGALIAGVPEDQLDAAGFYWVPAALLATLATAGYSISLQRRLKKEGRLKIWHESA